MGRWLAQFEDRSDLTLKGVLFEPEPAQRRRDLGFVYLPGIVLGATAVHGLGFKLGGHLAAAGCSFGLFDPPGVGESEGDYPAGTHEEISDWVAEGNLIDATLQTVDWMKDRLGIDRFALIGHCGGALTAAYCAARHPSIAGALLISPPPLRREKGKREVERPEVADEYFKGYAGNVFDPGRWKRLLTGESDYRTLVTVVRSKAARFVRAKLGRHPPQVSLENPGDNERFNRRLVEATRRSLELDKKLTVVFGDRDVDINNFRDFHRIYMDDTAPLVVIEDTSHGFTTAEGQSRLIEEVLGFADRFDG
jgi:pimeloyl-ACP methyl ester carboxylesterase